MVNNWSAKQAFRRLWLALRNPTEVISNAKPQTQASICTLLIFVQIYS